MGTSVFSLTTTTNICLKPNSFGRKYLHSSIELASPFTVSVLIIWRVCQSLDPSRRYLCLVCRFSYRFAVVASRRAIPARRATVRPIPRPMFGNGATNLCYCCYLDVCRGGHCLGSFLLLDLCFRCSGYPTCRLCVLLCVCDCLGFVFRRSWICMTPAGIRLRHVACNLKSNRCGCSLFEM